MRNIQKNEHWLGSFYRHGVAPVTGYVNADSGLIPSAPLIHSYNPSFTSIFPSLAITKPPITVQIKGESYQVKHFLTVQKLDRDLCTDDEGAFRPTVKPHYAIAPDSGHGTQYNHRCPTLLLEGQTIVHQASLPVHTHDRRLSPATAIKTLKDKMLDAFKKDNSLFVNSFVVDEVNKKIIITQHCLLTESEHDALLHTLNTTPTLEALVSTKTPIKQALELYESSDLEDMRYLTAAISNKPPSAPTVSLSQTPAKQTEVSQKEHKSPSADDSLKRLKEARQAKRKQLVLGINKELEIFKTEIVKTSVPEDKYKRAALDLYTTIRNDLEHFKLNEEETPQKFFAKIKLSFKQTLSKFDEGTTLHETILNFFIHIANFFRSEQNQIGLYRPTLDPVVKQAYEKLDDIQRAQNSQKPTAV